MRHTLFAAALLASPTLSMAQDLSYTHVDIRYFSTDADALTVSQQGGLLSASLALGSIFFVAADGSYAQSEDFTIGTQTGKVETTGAALRIGAHHAIAPGLDLVASAGGLYVESSGTDGFDGIEEDDTGYLAQLGLRTMIFPKVEIGAFFDYQSISDADTSSFTLDAQYHLSPLLAIVAAASNGSDQDLYNVGFRYKF